MASIVAKHDEMEMSTVLWPFTKKGTWVVIAAVAGIIGGTILGIELCNGSQTCSDSWKRRAEVWGERKEIDSQGIGEYCERIDTGDFVGEHMNGISNILVYCTIGFFVLFIGLADAYRMGSLAPFLRAGNKTFEFYFRNQISTYPVFSIFYGLACIALGICSFMFHSYATRLTQHLDVAAMYPNLLIACCHAPMLFVDVNMKKIRLAALRFVLMALSIALSIHLGGNKWGFSATKILQGCITTLLIVLFLLVLCRKVPRLRRFFFPVNQTNWTFRRPSLALFGILSFLLAYLIRQMGVSRKWCNPDLWLQPHAVWHLGTGLALLFLYLFMRSEFIQYEEEEEEEEEKKEREKNALDEDRGAGTSVSYV